MSSKCTWILTREKSWCAEKGTYVLFFVLCFSILGAILIVFGLYTVVWGKSKDPLALDEPLKDEKGSVNHELPVTAANNSINGRT